MVASANVLLYITISKTRCWIYCSFKLHNCFILKSKITPIYFHSLYHPFSFIVPLVVICCHSLSLVVILCHSLSFVVTCCHSLYDSLSLVVTRCHWLSLVAIRCATRCHSLSLYVPLVCPFINDQLSVIHMKSNKWLFHIYVNVWKEILSRQLWSYQLYIYYVSSKKSVKYIFLLFSYCRVMFFM